METPITIGAELGLSFYIAVGIVVGVNAIKWIFVKLPWVWTNKIPDWAWAVWAIAFAMVACYFLRVDVLSKLFAAADFNLEPPWSYLASGFLIGVSSNVLYKVVTPISKKLKNAQGKVICLPPGVALPVPSVEEGPILVKPDPKAPVPIVIPDMPVVPVVLGSVTADDSTDVATMEEPVVSETETVVPIEPVVQPVQQPEIGQQSEVILVKRVGKRDYVMIDGQRYLITACLLELYQDEP